MCKKLMFLISFVFVLGIFSSAYAETVYWTNDYPWSDLWISPWNWDPVTPYGGPTSGDNARIESGPMGPVVDTDATAYEIQGPARGGGGDQEMLLIKDANLVVEGNWELRGEEDDPSRGIINMSDSAIASVGSFRVHDEHAKCILNMTDDAQLICRNDLRFGDNGDEYFELNMTDNAYLYVANDDDRMRQNEGEFHIDVAGNAIIETARIRARARTDNVTDTITVRENGQIICYDDYFRLAGGSSTVIVNVLDNGVIDADGYFGLGEDNDFSGQAVVNMSGQLISSDDFRFIMDGSASGFTTVNLDSGVINTEGDWDYDTLNWIVNICGDGVWIIDGDVVDDLLEHADAGRIVACPQLDCFGDISPRGNLMIDYDNVNPGKTTMWVEHTPDTAWSPRPEDGATGVPSIGTILCWCLGDSAVVSHVFLGTDEALVAARDPSTYMGPVHEDNCYDPGVLQLCTTYYWAVDEQDLGITITPGPVWSFTVECCRVIEGFEAYTINPDYIWDVWIDGCGDLYGHGGNATGSCVSLSMDILHEGAKAMTYTYENEPYGIWDRDANYSEATRTFDPPLDLTLTGEAAMVAYFYGDGDNDLTDMWIVLNGSVADMAVYGDNGENPADIQSPEWMEWNMDLANFGGVDLSSVATVSIGFGDVVGNIADSARGVMRIDDISVCPVRCVPMFIDHIIDLNDDCVTDMLDVGIFCDNWLEDRR
jgi:hypothetical protein